jgi:hypothetical protein
MTSRNNPCKGREAGCTGDGSPRCDNCRRLHNERERKRRQARRKECGCWVCGAVARQVDGVYQATCEAHRTYSADVRRVSAAER